MNASPRLDSKSWSTGWKATIGFRHAWPGKTPPAHDVFITPTRIQGIEKRQEGNIVGVIHRDFGSNQIHRD